MSHETRSNTFAHGLPTAWIGRNVLEFDEVDSTNIVLRDMANTGEPAGTVVLAHHQSAGRGRLGRPWIDTPGENLLFSVLLRPQFAREQYPLLTFVAAVSVAEAIERQTELVPECKWPNDILLNGRKCCGILLESSTDTNRQPYAVIGIGLNVNQREFPTDFSSRTTSLSLECGSILDRLRLFQALLESLERRADESARGDFSTTLRMWQRRSRMFGRPVLIAHGDSRYEALAVDLAPDGGLVVESNGSRSTVYAGDVTLSI